MTSVRFCPWKMKTVARVLFVKLFAGGEIHGARRSSYAKMEAFALIPS